ncbi:MAG: helix-turn-helix transcriptional regulator [Syntrophothermus sp.]|uniref:helix-turn-helix domain-containing protein n=1 Tax=Syntrophothermus sp. TaxID=2736299 RepID=UPI002580E42F|nr:helix-turn-helix transcriptional regulator [Syntrophothermus sp.]NSW84516.1 helix-turn-helix transcriptional regulator [Syntrophothermus sp.]
MIEFRVHLKMAEKKWRIKDLAEHANIGRDTVSRYYHGRVSAIEVDVLNKICKALNCQPGDLLVYVPEEKEDGE